MYYIRKFLALFIVMILILSQSVPSYASTESFVSEIICEEELSLEEDYHQLPNEASTEALTELPNETATEVLTELPIEVSTQQSTERLTEETIIEENNSTVVTSDNNEVRDSEIETGNQTNNDGCILYPDLYNLGNRYSLSELHTFSQSSVRFRLVTYALQYLGNKYVWGGTSLTNGTDCSGFTQSIYQYFQIDIPRVAADQYKQSYKIQPADLKPGDLVFYSDSQGYVNHVALYIGNEQIIHASSSKVGIIISNMNYRKIFGCGSYMDASTTLQNNRTALKVASGFYVSDVIGNYFNGVRASAYTIGSGESSNVGMGICCDHSAATVSAQSGLTQINDPEELTAYGYDKELQFNMAIICSLAPYARGGVLDNPFINWQDFGCTTPSQANALCSLACSYLCGKDYGGISQAEQLANWVVVNGHQYWDFYGYIQNAALSNTVQNNITQIISQNGQQYYMSSPMRLTGNHLGSTFKVISNSISMQAVISDTDNISSIKDVFSNMRSTANMKFYSNVQNTVIDKNQYLTIFYPVSSNSTGKTITAKVVPTKYGSVYRLNYYVPSGNYQPVVMCDGSTTNKEISLSFSSAAMGKIIIKKKSENPSITDNHPNYSLKGAKYNIYNENGTIAYYFTSSTGKLAKAENLTTNATGNIIVEYDGKKTTDIYVLPGIYYVKEVKASPGYQMDSCGNPNHKGHMADVRTKSKATIICSEPPVGASTSVAIYKCDKDAGESENCNDLSGAVFKINYYHIITNRFSDIPDTPTKTWYIETQKNNANQYTALLDEQHLSSQYHSDTLYRDSSGCVIFPLGTITITEMQPPANYLNIDFHGAYDDGVNHITDVTNVEQATFYGVIRQTNISENNADLYIRSSTNVTTNNPTYGNLSITYSDHKKPTLKTQAFIDETGCNISNSIQETACYDMVSIKGLSKGQTYTLVSEVINKESGEVIQDSAGNDCIHTQQFCAEDTEEVHKIPVGNLSGNTYMGQKLVIREYLKWDDRIISEETNLDNTDQTIFFPSIKTTASAEGNTSYASLVSTVHLTDSVAYQGLIPDKNYTVKGQLMYVDAENKASPLLDRNGNPCTVTKTFIPKEENGTMDMNFVLDTAQYMLKGITVVVFEDLYYNDILLATHSDITDSNQTIYFPEARSSIVSNDTGIQNPAMNHHMKLTDTITYSHLEIGSEHVIKGTLMNQHTGKAIKDSHGNVVTSEIYFTPLKEQGTVLVPFSFDIDTTDGMNGLVCYENIYRIRDNQHIIQHEDINDRHQTVYFPDIQTTAWEQSSKSNIAEPKKDITIIDTVKYSGLMKGETYTVKGKMVMKDNINHDNYLSELPIKYSVLTDENGISCNPLVIDQKPITGETTFVAEDSDGTVEVVYTFDASELNGMSAVIFEDLYYNNDIISTHRDIECQQQTIQFIKSYGDTSIQEEHDIKTGDFLWLQLMVSFLIFFILFIMLAGYNRQLSSEKIRNFMKNISNFNINFKD